MDSFAQDHPHLTRMRSKVYAPPGALRAAGQRASSSLTPALARTQYSLPQRGYRLHATDVAPGMLERLRQKVRELGLQERVTVEQRSFLSISDVPEAPFDAVFSDLGGLNCVADLSP